MTQQVVYRLLKRKQYRLRDLFFCNNYSFIHDLIDQYSAFQLCTKHGAADVLIGSATET